MTCHGMPHGRFTGLDETYPVNYAVLSQVEQQHVRPAGAQQLHRGLACRGEGGSVRVSVGWYSGPAVTPSVPLIQAHTPHIIHTCRLDSEQHRVHWVVVKAARETFGSAVCAYVPDSGGAVLGSADDQAPASAAFIAGIHTQHSLLVPFQLPSIEHAFLF